ncbi:ABC transporter ATP-binding protein YtrB [Paraliobacillus sp. PM-2]|uniref:ABC transporter ATP-binding protein n=1 Tax=Paraliobacillus sp. PM-2 TaxID=1462524 RepID=UPI00061C6905|nr:ABC transporter ATP-binding protein [Paraliobacillus sp. PM-2]CQR47878.1 ABC transporter ATP-binding protein YtrB [Paraliobacillus sp. PM-2]
MIKLTQISKQFEKEKVLDHISFAVEKGSIYGLLGSNGAGKTTLLKIIAGILKQDQGEIGINKQPVYENPNVKQKVMFIPDLPFSFPQYTVKQMAEFYANIYDTWNQERFHKLHTLLGLDLNRKVARFSKGMQRQVAFWLALCTMPDVLILDEPFDGLDAVVRQKIKNLIIQDVADRQMTVIISSHNLREIEDICDHVGILHHGSFILEKDLDDLKSDIHKVQIAFKNEDFKILEKLDIVHQEKRGSVFLLIVRGSREAIDQMILSHEPVVYDLLPLTLEEIFVYEMGGVGYAIENILV